MTDVTGEIEILSEMKRNLSPNALRELQGKRGTYAERLGAVAAHTFFRNDLIDGTTMGAASVLTFGRKNRLREVLIKRAMYVRSLPLPGGRITFFPLHVVGITHNQTPVIDPTIQDSYSIVHTPATWESDRHIPSGMKIDMALTIDVDDHLTVDGPNPATAAEYVLFDGLVRQLERRAEIDG